MNLNSLNADAGLLIVRLMTAGMLLFHGVSKILHPASLDYIGGMLSGVSLPSILAYAVYLGEVVAPLMVIAGFKTRLAALVIVINMLFALLLAHSGDFFSLSEHGGWMVELQMFYLLSALAMMFLGSGKFAVQPD